MRAALLLSAVEVASPAGAWIETTRLMLSFLTYTVASPAGAWIETATFAYTGTECESRLPQARGLKLAARVVAITTVNVASPAGAWIETSYIRRGLRRISCRVSRRRVD